MIFFLSSSKADIKNNSVIFKLLTLIIKVYLNYKQAVFVIVQNHRRYVRSRDDLQLHGELNGKVSSDCDPFAKVNDTPIAPCGAIANSLFNGKFQ